MVGKVRRKNDLHPLFNSWRSATRLARHKAGIDERWHKFENFVDDVSPRPSEDHRLFKKNSDLPYSKDNFVWKLCITNKNKNNYMREYRQRNLDHWRNKRMKKLYDISADQYELLLKEQNSVCATCGVSETAKYKPTGKPYNLAVDHCHATGKVRGLLCANCNRAIGLLLDNPQIARSVADYLQKHAPI